MVCVWYIPPLLAFVYIAMSTLIRCISMFNARVFISLEPSSLVAAPRVAFALSRVLSHVRVGKPSWFLSASWSALLSIDPVITPGISAPGATWPPSTSNWLARRNAICRSASLVDCQSSATRHASDCLAPPNPSAAPRMRLTIACASIDFPEPIEWNTSMLRSGFLPGFPDKKSAATFSAIIWYRSSTPPASRVFIPFAENWSVFQPGMSRSAQGARPPTSPAPAVSPPSAVPPSPPIGDARTPEINGPGFHCTPTCCPRTCPPRPGCPWTWPPRPGAA